MSSIENERRYTLDNLIYLMQRLRDPQTGCPWDLKQNYKSIVPSTLEEVYEVVDAIESENYDHLSEELGDLFFQIIFYSQLAQEEERFSFSDIVHGLTAKLVRRHPHVFPDATLESSRNLEDKNQDDVIKANWERIKQEERAEKGLHGILDDVPLSLAALNRASKLQKRAAKVGFDWPDAKGAIEKLEEEIIELKEAVDSKNQIAIEDEFGDVLFASVNVSRHLKVDAEQSLRLSSKKFEQRIQWMEKTMFDNALAWEDQSEIELDKLWEAAKLALNT